MIDAQQMRRKMSAAVLAHMPIAGQNIAAAQVNTLFGQAIEREQTNDARHLYFEIDGTNPIVVGMFRFGTQFAHFSPRVERIGGELAVFEVNNLGQFAAKQGKSTPHIHDVDRHEKPVEHEHAARQCTDGGWRGGWRGNNTPASRAMHPGTVRIGCRQALHVQPPMLCQSLYCSLFSDPCQRRGNIFYADCKSFPVSGRACFLRKQSSLQDETMHAKKVAPPIFSAKFCEGRLVRDPSCALG
jgi:hypothetical protein